MTWESESRPRRRMFAKMRGKWTCPGCGAQLQNLRSTLAQREHRARHEASKRHIAAIERGKR